MEFKPLQCSGCGGAVPLGPGRSCSCPFCGTEVPIPQNYEDWRRQNEEKLFAEETLVNLHERLGKTPRFWEVWLSRLKGGCGCSGCLLFYVTMMLGNLLIRAESALFSATSSSSSQPANPDAGGSLVITLFVLLPYRAATVAVVLVLAFARRKVLTLATLQGKLLASPPVHEGGPATCRTCGGPLLVQPGHLCSPCFYCGTQNLVALDPQWCEQLRRTTTQSRESFAEAMAVYHETTAKAKRSCGLTGRFSFCWAGSLATQSRTAK